MNREIKIQEILITYFSSLGIFLLLNFSTDRYLSELFNVDLLTTHAWMSSLGWIAPLVISIFFWKRWDHSRGVIIGAVGFYVLMPILALLYAFTYPIWIVFGLITILYAIYYDRKRGRNVVDPNSASTSKRGLLKFLGGGILILVALYYISQYGFSFPPCSERERSLEIPTFLRGSTIIFESNEMFYAIGRETKTKQCTSISKKAKGVIIADGLFQSGAYQNIPIPSDAEFAVVERAYIDCVGISCIGGTKGDIFLLKNEKGELYTVRPIYFSEVGGKAAYYKNGQRIDSVEIERVIQ